MSPARVLTIGDGHSDPIKRARAATAPYPQANIEAERMPMIKGDQPIGGIGLDAFLARIGRPGAHGLVVTVLGGNPYNAFGLAKHR